MRGCERCGRGHNDPLGGGLESPDPHDTDLPQMVAFQIALQRFQLSDDLVGVTEEHLPGAGDPKVPTLLFCYLAAQFPGQRGELLRNGRGSEVQSGGGGVHRALPVELLKNEEPTYVDHAQIIKRCFTISQRINRWT